MKKYFKYILSIIIIIITFTCIFYQEGLYPFGTNSLVQVDADYQFIPVLYRIYDFLHGNASIIYDDIGLGNNIYISMIIQGSLFSPINLLLYFTTRSNIINFYNILVVVKICLLSITSLVYINYKFKINNYYQILFSILYALSGWTMLNYFNIMWLDVVILFPILIMYLDKLLHNENTLGYIIILSLSLIISYYISSFILIFIIFYSFLNIYLFKDKKESKKIIYKLGISTLISILISSFSLIPALYQTFLSSRLESSSQANIGDCFVNKSLYLMASPLFIILFSKLIIKYKQNRKTIFIFLVLLFLFLIGMFIEPINLALHFGSHWSFPYRYSFITIFILMIGSLFYLSKYPLKGTKKWYWAIIFLIILIGGVSYNQLHLETIKESQIVLDFDDNQVYIDILVIFFISLVITYIALTFKNKQLMYFTLSLSSIFIIYVYSSWTVFYSSGYFLTKDSVAINENLQLPKDGRYKMNYTVYTPSYGFIYDVNTLDNWLHILPSSEVNTYKSLGYETSDTCIRSYGGTIFSDWLLNFKYLISKERLDDPIYKYIDKYNEYYLYQYNYNSGFGVTYNNLIPDYIEISNPFEAQNYIYNNIYNDDLIEITEYYQEYTNNYTFTYSIKEKGFLYLYSDYYPENIDYVKVNDKYIYDFDNYIKYLGIYDSDTEITLSLSEEMYLSYNIGFIPYNKITSLFNNLILKDNILEVNSNDSYLLLPINNINGLSIKNNGKEVNINNYFNNFVSINLEKGQNKIEINYEMPLFRISIILSIVGIILLLLRNKILDINFFQNVSYYVYHILTFGLIFYFYIYSFIKYMYN